MLLVIATGGTHPFTPPWLCDETGAPREGAPVYLLKVGTLLERGLFEATLASPPYNARRVFDYELAAAAFDGLAAFSPEGADLGELQAVIGKRQLGALPTARDKSIWAGLEETLIANYPPYAALKAADTRRDVLLPLLAARHFLRAIDGTTVEQGADGLVVDAALVDIAPLDLRVLGYQAYNLLYGGAYSKNSAPPPKSAATPAASRMVRPARTAKVSSATARTGRKTPR